ncbi:MAG TPA: hypothetical protein VJ650_18230 [Gemmatimonadaceae bacterium]|nr:hypothetical protein [Gemmatimonadaceae bacterium]
MSIPVRAGVFGLLAVQSCSPAPRNDAAAGHPDIVLEATDSAATEFYRTVADEYESEREAIRRAGHRVSRTPGTLRITTRNGGLRSLVDTIVDGGRHLRFVYDHFAPHLDAHVIREQYYEGHAYLLVNDSSGRDTLLASVPILSPDNRRFAVASLDLDAFYHPNILQVWRPAGDSVLREFEIDAGEAWGPDSVSWISEDTIRFVRTRRNRGELTDLYSSHILVRRADTWAIDPVIP